MTGKAPTALFGCATTLTFDVATGISDYCLPPPPPGSHPPPSPPTFSVGGSTPVADVQSALDGGLDVVVPSGVALDILGSDSTTFSSRRAGR